jgi:hypothetical protein
VSDATESVKHKKCARCDEYQILLPYFESQSSIRRFTLNIFYKEKVEKNTFPQME